MPEEYFGSARCTHAPSNCKLTYIDYANSLYGLEGNNLEKKIEKVKRFFRQCRIVISLNVTNEAVKDFFVTNFETYSVSKIPVGYGNVGAGKYQYHIIIKNNDSSYPNAHYLRPVEKESLPDKLEESLTKALKAKRRKTDIVKEVIAGLAIN